MDKRTALLESLHLETELGSSGFMATDLADMTSGATPATKLHVRKNHQWVKYHTILNVVWGPVEPVDEDGVLGVVRLLFGDGQHPVGEARFHRCVVDHLLRLSVADGLLTQNCVLLHLLLRQPDELGTVGRLVAQSSCPEHRVSVLSAQVLKVLVRSLKKIFRDFFIIL